LLLPLFEPVVPLFVPALFDGPPGGASSSHAADVSANPISTPKAATHEQDERQSCGCGDEGLES